MSEPSDPPERRKSQRQLPPPLNTSPNKGSKLAGTGLCSGCKEQSLKKDCERMVHTNSEESKPHVSPSPYPIAFAQDSGLLCCGCAKPTDDGHVSWGSHGARVCPVCNARGRRDPAYLTQLKHAAASSCPIAVVEALARSEGASVPRTRAGYQLARVAWQARIGVLL